jgi:hypothetical protein
VIANPKQVRIIAHAKIKFVAIDAGVLARLYASRLLLEVCVLDGADADASPAGDHAQPDRTMLQSIPHSHLINPVRTPICAGQADARRASREGLPG